MKLLMVFCFAQSCSSDSYLEESEHECCSEIIGNFFYYCSLVRQGLSDCG